MKINVRAGVRIALLLTLVLCRLARPEASSSNCFNCDFCDGYHCCLYVDFDGQTGCMNGDYYCAEYGGHCGIPAN